MGPELIAPQIERTIAVIPDASTASTRLIYSFRNLVQNSGLNVAVTLDANLYKPNGAVPIFSPERISALSFQFQLPPTLELLHQIKRLGFQDLAARVFLADLEPSIPQLNYDESGLAFFRENKPVQVVNPSGGEYAFPIELSLPGVRSEPFPLGDYLCRVGINQPLADTVVEMSMLLASGNFQYDSLSPTFDIITGLRIPEERALTSRPKARLLN